MVYKYISQRRTCRKGEYIMDINRFPKLVREYYNTLSGRHSQLESICGNRVLTLSELPFIDYNSFSSYLGVTPEILASITDVTTKACYSRFYIDKNTKKIVPYSFGIKLREINAPTEALKELQLKLMEFFNRFPKHPCNYAFMQGKNIVDAAKTVANDGVLIHVDLKDFFPAHTSLYVQKGLEHLIAENFNTNLPLDVLSRIVKLVCLDGVLPQGAPTSPILTIILNYDFDCRVAELAEKFGLTYTRYADDLCFSGNKSDAECQDFISELSEIVHPFRMNYKKVGIMRDKAYPIVTGFRIKTKVTYLPSTQSAKIIRIITDFLQMPDLRGTISAKTIDFTFSRNTKIPLDELPETLARITELVHTKYPNLEFIVKPVYKYIQSVKTVLGLHISNSEVKYPRSKYNDLRVEAMLIGKQLGIREIMYNIHPARIALVKKYTAKNTSLKPSFRNLLLKPLNKRVFNGKLAFLSMVDPDKSLKLKAIMDKHRKKTVEDMIKLFKEEGF